MFLIRTALSAFGTASAHDALARLQSMEQAGFSPTVLGFSGKVLQVSDLQRWTVHGTTGSSRRA